MTKREQFIAWLGDAHAMEVGIVDTLEKQIADAKGLPKVRAALTKHLRETKQHANEMKKALAAVGGTHPVLKEGVSKLVNLAAGLVNTTARDTVIKNALTASATEAFEIACYRSLILTANALGEKKIAATCKGILKEEQAMAKLLENLFPGVNDAYLATLDDDAAPAEDEAEPKSAGRRAGSKKAAPAKKPAKKKSGK